MATALELGPEGWKAYIEARSMRGQGETGVALSPSEREQMLDRVREVASELKSRFGVDRVILFGSLAHGARFTDDSDIDIAVEGLESDDYWRAWEVAEEMLSDRVVDLVEIESATNSMKRTIFLYGISL
jgi:predicted nucleotidyltransferase